MKKNKKLVSFTDTEQDFAAIQKQVDTGWQIVSVMSNGSGYLCVLESNDDSSEEIRIPPRRKIKLKLASIG